MYNFYIKLDGVQYGPYSATQIVNQYLDDIESLDDIEVMEASIGVWHRASDYPWSELVMKETGGGISPSGEVVAGGNYRGTYVPPTQTTSTQTTTTTTTTPNNEDKPSIGLNILSFLIPIVGWILYFALEKGEKASACAKWAWIGFGVNLLLIFIGNAG